MLLKNIKSVLIYDYIKIIKPLEIEWNSVYISCFD